jgi:hypothetical protein
MDSSGRSIYLAARFAWPLDSFGHWIRLADGFVLLMDSPGGHRKGPVV